MPEYTVHIYSTVSAAVTVEADDPDQASEVVWDSADLPGSITHQAFGTGVSVDHDGDWEISAISDESGEEVWAEWWLATSRTPRSALSPPTQTEAGRA